MNSKRVVVQSILITVLAVVYPRAAQAGKSQYHPIMESVPAATPYGIILLLLIILLILILRLRTFSAAKQSLVESSSSYRNIIENTIDIIYSLDNTGVFTYVSPAWKKLLGHDESEVYGHSYKEFVHPDDIEICAIQLKKVLESDVPQKSVEYRVRHKNGEWRWHVSSANANKNTIGTPIGFNGIARDVTDRIKMEEELRKSESNLRSVIESSPVGFHIYNLNENGKLIFSMFNNAADTILHVSHKPFMGREMLDAFPALAGTGIAEMYTAVARGELGIQNFEAPYDFEGIQGVYEVRVFRGAPGQAVVNFVDISERKRAEKSIAHAQKLLEAKNHELEQLIYVASHDLRSPLVNVDGFSRELDYAIKEVHDALENGSANAELESKLRQVLPDIDNALGRIRASTRQMDNLLKGLLTLSRMGRAALQIGPVDMNSVIQQLESSFAFRIRESGITFTKGDLPSCKGDTTQVTQVFSNLIDNAIKYRSPQRPCIIEIQGAIEGDRAVYHVKDNGIGIAEKYKEKVFELFHRLNPKDSDGDGLGLTAAKQILARLDGEILLESTTGEGCIFTVRLPFASTSSSKA